MEVAISQGGGIDTARIYRSYEVTLVQVRILLLCLFLHSNKAMIEEIEIDVMAVIYRHLQIERSTEVL